MIYIVSKGNSVTGGPETLHQMAGILKSKGAEAKMYYVSPYTTHVPDKYKEYCNDVADQIIDSKNNVIIVPETLSYILSKYKYINKVLWWLSLDYYLINRPINRTTFGLKTKGWPLILWPLEFIGLLLKGELKFDYYKFDNDNNKILHLYNCEYVKRFIATHGVATSQLLYACGPLNDSYFELNITNKTKNNVRENIVLYNPKKGKEFTIKLLKAAQSRDMKIEFIPLENLSQDEVIYLMERAKVYIDFGYFPGPERIPREAVTLGCNIITSKRGSAANDIDVPIPNNLKFEDSDDNIGKILDIIEDMLLKYDLYFPLYDNYRLKIKNQKKKFQDAADLLILKYGFFS